jgi:hypothetical protein
MDRTLITRLDPNPLVELLKRRRVHEHRSSGGSVDRLLLPEIKHRLPDVEPIVARYDVPNGLVDRQTRTYGGVLEKTRPRS